MSRIGRKPIPIPSGVTVTIEGALVRLNGPKGNLSATFRPEVDIKQEESQLVITAKDPSRKDHRAYWGLTRALLRNMTEGVAKGFERRLELQGVGFRAQAQGAGLVLALGFSHPVNFELPQGVTAKVEKNIIVLEGIDKQLLGETAASLRRLKPPEPYKGKGIRYVDEQVRRKVGKVVKAAGAG